MNNTIANTFKITKTFSTRAVSDIPRDKMIAVIMITTAAMISMTPPSAPNGFDNALGKTIPNGEMSPLRLAENPDATKATAIKYSAKSAQPATQPENSPNKTLIQE